MAITGASLTQDVTPAIENIAADRSVLPTTRVLVRHGG